MPGLLLIRTEFQRCNLRNRRGYQMTDVTEDLDHDEPGLPTADEMLLRELTERARAG
jgi:hypothetical protein